MRAKILVPSAVILLLALVAFMSTMWISYTLRSHSVPADIAEGVRQVVEQSPHLQPLYTAAVEDGVLTMVEANEILAAAEDTPD